MGNSGMSNSSMSGSIGQQNRKYLTCERLYIFELLIMAAGMMGAYTYNLRGGVFCNAQTANVVLMAMSFGKGEWQRGVYYLIPISAYILGAVISELLPTKVRRIRLLRWDTYLIGFEMIVLFLIGFIPLSCPVQIVQVMINFVCSMQYNTFRQAEGIPMATTFVTNHVRQTGIWLAKAWHTRERQNLIRAGKHLRMLGAFFLGGFLLTILCSVWQEKVIWLALLPLGIGFLVMFRADRGSEQDQLYQTPRGH